MNQARRAVFRLLLDLKNKNVKVLFSTFLECSFCDNVKNKGLCVGIGVLRSVICLKKVFLGLVCVSTKDGGKSAVGFSVNNVNNFPSKIFCVRFSISSASVTINRLINRLIKSSRCVPVTCGLYRITGKGENCNSDWLCNFVVMSLSQYGLGALKCCLLLVVVKDSSFLPSIQLSVQLIHGNDAIYTCIDDDNDFGHADLKTRVSLQLVLDLVLLIEYVHDHRSVVLVRSGDIETNPGPLFQVMLNAQTPIAQAAIDVARGRDGHDGHDSHDIHDDQLQPDPVPAARNTHQKVKRTDLQVISHNVRGLSDSRKVRHVINNCYKLTKASSNSFFMFQETFVLRLDILKYLWRGEFHLTPGLGNSQGCLTLVTAPYKIVHAINLANRAHVLVVTKDNTNRAEAVIVNVYAPNGYAGDKITFFQELTELIADTIASFNCENVAQDRKLLLMTKLDDLRQLKRALVEKAGTKLEQRTARKWYNEGELSSRYFFNLLNRKSNDEISSLLDDDGTEVKDPRVIENRIVNFYKDLYESVPEQVDTDDNFFRNITSIPEDETAPLEEVITLEELTATLRTCADSAPGPDGIPYSFLKHYWKEFGPVILSSWHYSMFTNELPASHKLSYLKLIPKAGKDTRVISNLRPITLSNTDHKLITKTLAGKLTAIVGKHIGGEQTAYIPGRLINDNIRAMLATVGLANQDDTVDGLIVSLDAKKAFDSVDHRYIRDCLKAFGLANFVPIFDVLYKGLRSQVIVNGRTIDGYSILKGVKQGDALSCILFIMCMEPLIRNIKQNVTISRIESRLLPIVIPKVYSFADDISVMTKNNGLALQEVFTEYELFTKISGLQLNAAKTEILCFNKERNSDQPFVITYQGVRHQLRAKEQIKINGILFQQEMESMEDANVAQAIESMERLLLSWSTRRLTLLGRIIIIKTFAISKLIYIMQSLLLTERSYKAVVKVIYKFLWNKNLNAARAPERIKRSIMLTPVEYGGFGMIDVAELSKALNLRAYGRLLTTAHPFFEQVKGLICCNDFFTVSLDYKVDSKVQKGLELLNLERGKILEWPTEVVLRNANLCSLLSNQKLKHFLKPAGRQSLNYFVLNNRLRNPSIAQLRAADIRSVERHFKYRGLARILTALVTRPVNIPVGTDSLEAFPTRDMSIVKISTLTSKALRQNWMGGAEQGIHIYKLGPILDPGELKAWTRRKKKLTSTRHKNILLRAIHGDIFVNSRLFKFRLTNDPKCLNCQEPVETIMHRLIECPKATEAWRLLEAAKSNMGLENLSDLSIENLLGIKDNVGKLELTLNAELIHRLSTRSEPYCPAAVVRTVIKYISYAEKLDHNMKQKLERWMSNEV